MPNLLLVDDNTQLLSFYRLVLEQAGHHVSTAETCTQALEIFDLSHPEIVLIDLRVPELKDGLGLIRAVKDRARQPRTKMIVLSGWVEDLAGTPEESAVDRVLPKPVRMHVLLRSIAELAPLLL
jgi:DNA-binding response OmpR family regulator